MTESFAAHFKKHGLAKRYALGLCAPLIAGIAAAYNGNEPSVIFIKTMIGLLYILAVSTSSGLFDPEETFKPFSPSFLHRTALTAVSFAVFLTSVGWTPEQDVLTSVRGFCIVAGVWFALSLISAKFTKAPKSSA